MTAGSSQEMIRLPLKYPLHPDNTTDSATPFKALACARCGAGHLQAALLCAWWPRRLLRTGARVGCEAPPVSKPKGAIRKHLSMDTAHGLGAINSRKKRVIAATGQLMPVQVHDLWLLLVACVALYGPKLSPI